MYSQEGSIPGVQTSQQQDQFVVTSQHGIALYETIYFSASPIKTLLEKTGRTVVCIYIYGDLRYVKVQARHMVRCCV